MTEPSATSFVDTHCHLDLVLERGAHVDEDALWKAMPLDGGMPEAMIHVACHPSTFELGERLATRHSDVRLTFGVHPHEANLYGDAVESDLIARMQNPRAVAWGEMGLDYHYEHSPRAEQKLAFARQLALAQADGRPVVLHTREADQDTLEVLRALPHRLQKMHVHCYTGSWNFAQALLECADDVVFGFTGIVTFRNAEELRGVAQSLAADRILLETDSPFLAPVPLRGKVATPGMVPHIAKSLAALRGIPECEFLQQCRKNTKRIYGF